MKKKENRFRQLTLSGRSADCVEHYKKKRSFLMFFLFCLFCRNATMWFLRLWAGGGMAYFVREHILVHEVSFSFASLVSVDIFIVLKKINNSFNFITLFLYLIYQRLLHYIHYFRKVFCQHKPNHIV